MAGVLEVVGIGSDASLWHALRRPGGSWQPTAGPVRDRTSGGPSNLLDVACSRTTEGALHVVAVGVNGDLWHTIRDAHGAWQSYFGNVGDQARSGPPFVHSVSILGIGTGLHVIGAAGWGLWHTLRREDGTWSSFDCIGDGTADGPRGLRESGIGSEDGKHLLAVGIAEHTTMWFITATASRAGARWDGPYRAVHDQAIGGPPGFTKVSCAGAGGVIHVVAVGNDGQLWHNVFDRDTAGLFTSFDPIARQSTRGPPSFVDVGCASDDGRSVHVVGLGSDGRLWHTIRNADGTWQPTFELVESPSSLRAASYHAVDSAGGEGLNVTR
jgi:hypothetical protein